MVRYRVDRQRTVRNEDFAVSLLQGPRLAPSVKFPQQLILTPPLPLALRQDDLDPFLRTTTKMKELNRLRKDVLEEEIEYYIRKHYTDRQIVHKFRG